MYSNAYDFGRPLAPAEMRDLLALYAAGGKRTDMNASDLNELSYQTALLDIMNLYMSVFQWDGLPKGVSARQLEYWLMTGGIVAFVYDATLSEVQPDEAPEGYAVLRCYLNGEINIYDLPDRRNLYSMVSAVNGSTIDPENSVLIWDSTLRALPLPLISYYARRLSNIDRTIDVNVANQKTTKVVRGTQKQLLSLQNAMNQQQGNQVIRWEDASSGIEGENPVAYDVIAPYVSDKLQILKRQLKSEVLTFCGVDNTYGDKRERLITGEVEQGAGDVNAHKIARLAPRRAACEEIAEKFGLDVTVRVASDALAEERMAALDAEDGDDGDKEEDNG